MTVVFRPSSPSTDPPSDRAGAHRRPIPRTRWVLLPGGQISVTALALGLTMMWPGLGRTDVGLMKHNPLEMTEVSLPPDARGVVVDLVANADVGWVLVRTGSGFAVVQFDPPTMAIPTTLSYPFSSPFTLLQAAVATDGTAWIVGTENDSEPLTQFLLLRLSGGKITKEVIRPDFGTQSIGEGDDPPMMHIGAVLALPEAVWLGGWVGVHSDQVAYAAFYGQIDSQLKWNRGGTVALESVMQKETGDKIPPYESGITALLMEKTDVVAVGYARIAESPKEWVWSSVLGRSKTKVHKIGQTKAGPPSPIVVADPGVGVATVFVPTAESTQIERWDWSPLDPKGASQHRDITLQSPLDGGEWPLLAVGFGPDYTHMWIGGDEPSWVTVKGDNTVEQYPASFLKPYRSTRAVVASQRGFWLAMEPGTNVTPPLTDVLLHVRLRHQ
ncbi:MAG: hypothetical protein HUU55_05620 [Myxococcales bacterium]|nr:hypothetical protein [Myxococcales bacterium]